MRLRPTIADYKNPIEFLNALLVWKKEYQGFVIYKACADVRCSPALVTQVLKSKRNLTPERLAAFAKVFELSSLERKIFETWLSPSDTEIPHEPSPSMQTGPAQRKPANHLLKDWANVYIKDLVRLKWFNENPSDIAKQLNGLFSAKRIRQSLRFLVHHGFLMRNAKGRLVENENLVTTSDNVPSTHIRRFHRNALAIAQRALEIYAVDRRKASTLVVALNKHSHAELKKLLQDFDRQLMNFAEQHSYKEATSLYQIILNVSPIFEEKEIL